MLARFSWLAVAVGLTFSAGLALADDGAERRDLLIRTIEQNGCAMSEETAEEVLPPLGFVPDETRVIVEKLQAEGLAAKDESGSLILMTENCR